MAEQSPSQLINDWQTAAKNKDASTLEKYYAGNAILCATEGIISGNSGISADFKTQFTNGWALTAISNQVINQGTGANWVWAYGQWSGTYPQLGALQGSWSLVLVNQPINNQPNWLIQQHTIVTNLPSSQK
jgi:ketosteroid isomerase-like protein